jgi:hypothetical protein
MNIGIVYEALLRLVALAGDSWESLTRMFQRVIDDPFHRRQVFAALSGSNAQAEQTEADWVERELSVFKRLAEFGIPMPTETEVANAWFEGCTPKHRFVPRNIVRRQLLEACHKAGIKVSGNDPKTADLDGGELLPTERGTLECDLRELMTPTNAMHHPFMLNHEQQVQWAKEQGGDDITSVEETLYVLLRAWVEIGRIPFMGGWIRCRNRYVSDDSLRVYWFADYGLYVSCGGLGYDDWSCGACSRKFRPSAL